MSAIFQFKKKEAATKMEAELRNIKSYMLGCPELVITEAYSYNMERSS